MIARHGVHIFAGALDLLSALNVASTLQDLSPLKSVRLHKLKGDRKGQWAMTVNARWRICFVFRKGDAHDVERQFEATQGRRDDCWWQHWSSGSPF